MEFEGIVIRRVPYKDDDVMITVLTENNIKSFLAKGVLKIFSKNASSTNLFTRSKFQVFKGKEGDFLRVGEIIESFPNINKNLDNLILLDFISEITNNFVLNDDSKYLYQFLLKTLQSINNNFSVFTATIIYFSKLLIVSGYGLNVDKCFNCGETKNIVGISITNGGFVCQNCFDEKNCIKLNSRMLKIFRYIFKVDLTNFDKIEFEKDECKIVIDFLIKLLSWHTQIELKSIKLIEKL